MLINPKNDLDLKKAKIYFNKLISIGSKFELKKISETRTAKQNRALHKYYNIIADELNNLGQEFHYQGLVIENLTSRYTQNIVKEFIWRPIQIALFDIESTTKINSSQINEIIDVITKYFAEKGILIQFPSLEILIDK